MKVLIGASAAAFLLVAAASAQTPATTTSAPSTVAVPPSSCGVIPPAPTVPDVSHLSAQQMNRANQTFTAWAADAQAKLDCHRAEVRQLTAQAAAAQAAFNQQATDYTTTANAWNAQAAAYTNSHGGSQTSSRGSALGQHGPH